MQALQSRESIVEEVLENARHVAEPSARVRVALTRLHGILEFNVRAAAQLLEKEKNCKLAPRSPQDQDCLVFSPPSDDVGHVLAFDEMTRQSRELARWSQLHAHDLRKYHAKIHEHILRYVAAWTRVHVWFEKDFRGAVEDVRKLLSENRLSVFPSYSKRLEGGAARPPSPPLKHNKMFSLGDKKSARKYRDRLAEEEEQADRKEQDLVAAQADRAAVEARTAREAVETPPRPRRRDAVWRWLVGP